MRAALRAVKMKIQACDLENDAHKGYLAVYRAFRNQDERPSDLFDDLRRSTSCRILMRRAEAGVITKEEFESFSDETKGRV
jgi:hypothetical protein